MSGGAFCRTELFTSKFPICGSTLLLTQWERKKDAAEWFADLAQETLGGEVWCTRLEATVVDGEETLSDMRFMSCAHRQLQTLYQTTVANGWLDDEDAVGFAQLAARLAAYRMVELEGDGARSIGGSARCSVPAKTRVCDVISQVVRRFVGDWERVHERPDGMRQQYVPRPPLDAPKITLLAQSFALGDGYVRGRVRAGPRRSDAPSLRNLFSHRRLLEVGLGELPDRQHVPARPPGGRHPPRRLRGLLGCVAAVRYRCPPQERRASRATTCRELLAHRLLPLVRALERAHATRDAVAAARAPPSPRSRRGRTRRPRRSR